MQGLLVFLLVLLALVAGGAFGVASGGRGATDDFPGIPSVTAYQPVAEGVWSDSKPAVTSGECLNSLRDNACVLPQSSAKIACTQDPTCMGLLATNDGTWADIRGERPRQLVYKAPEVPSAGVQGTFARKVLRDPGHGSLASEW